MLHYRVPTQREPELKSQWINSLLTDVIQRVTVLYKLYFKEAQTSGSAVWLLIE